MIGFVDFLLKSKVYNSKPIPENIILSAFEKTVKDVQYHFNIDKHEIERRIKINSNELAIFLYRLGRELLENSFIDLTGQVHWLLKEMCNCELYFNTRIDEGFYIVHGQGTIIGSRNIIGKGFIIHHGCTIGHKKNDTGKGTKIGSDVTIYCNSSIIGELIIGDNVVVGAHILVTNDLFDRTILTKHIKT